MDNVYLSKSVAEYWKRWDTPLQDIYFNYAYKPARRLGLSRSSSGFITFFVSGLFHLYPAWIAGLSETECVMIMVYFVLQPFLIAVESTILKVHDMPAWQARLWVLFATFLSSVVMQLPSLSVPRSNTCAEYPLEYLILL